MITDATIQEAIRRLVEGFRPESIILFGSCARDGAGSANDIDLLVVFSRIEDRNALEAEMLAAMRGIPVPIDILAYTRREYEMERRIVGTIAWPAAIEGKVVYSRAA